MGCDGQLGESDRFLRPEKGNLSLVSVLFVLLLRDRD